jgi:hypothetical protein
MPRLYASIVLAATLCCFAGPLAAQQQTTSSKTRPGDNANAVGTVLGERPGKVLAMEKVKGVVKSVDLDERVVTITLDGKSAPLQLAFAQPAGREQIKVSKKAARTIGKAKMTLEEVKTGSRVEAQYYIALGQMLELTIESGG